MHNWRCIYRYNLIFWNLPTFISVWWIRQLENEREKVTLYFLLFKKVVDTVSQINHGQENKKSILQLKYLIRFAQALFKPKGNSIEKFYTLEGIWDIRTN